MKMLNPTQYDTLFTGWTVLRNNFFANPEGLSYRYKASLDESLLEKAELPLYGWTTGGFSVGIWQAELN